MDIKKLNSDVIAKIRSSCNVSTVAQCVFELVCNSLDANSTSIAVRLNLLTHKIQVIDNGRGVPPQNLALLGAPHHTSKCHVISDLETLKTYGFKGLAISSIVQMCKAVTITSKSAHGTFTKVLSSNFKSEVKHSKDRGSSGVTVSVVGFMNGVPVRQRRMIPELELEEVKARLMGLVLINPKCSLSVRNDVTGLLVLNCPKQAGVVEAFRHLYPQVSDKFTLLKVSKGRISIRLLIHKDDTSRYQYVYVNKRPVNSTKLVKYFCKRLKHKPVFVMNIKCPVDQVDVIGDEVEFTCWTHITGCVDKVLQTLGVDVAKQLNIPKPKISCGLSQIYGAVHGKAFKRKSSDSNEGNKKIKPDVVKSKPKPSLYGNLKSIESKLAVKGGEPVPNPLTQMEQRPYTSLNCNEQVGKGVILDKFLKSAQAEVDLDEQVQTKAIQTSQNLSDKFNSVTLDGRDDFTIIMNVNSKQRREFRFVRKSEEDVMCNTMEFKPLKLCHQDSSEKMFHFENQQNLGFLGRQVQYPKGMRNWSRPVQQNFGKQIQEEFNPSKPQTDIFTTRGTYIKPQSIHQLEQNDCFVPPKPPKQLCETYYKGPSKENCYLYQEEPQTGCRNPLCSLKPCLKRSNPNEDDRRIPKVYTNIKPTKISRKVYQEQDHDGGNCFKPFEHVYHQYNREHSPEAQPNKAELTHTPHLFEPRNICPDPNIKPTKTYQEPNCFNRHYNEPKIWEAREHSSETQPNEAELTPPRVHNRHHSMQRKTFPDPNIETIKAYQEPSCFKPSKHRHNNKPKIWEREPSPAKELTPLRAHTPHHLEQRKQFPDPKVYQKPNCFEPSKLGYRHHNKPKIWERETSPASYHKDSLQSPEEELTSPRAHTPHRLVQRKTFTDPKEYQEPNYFEPSKHGYRHKPIWEPKAYLEQIPNSNINAFKEPTLDAEPSPVDSIHEEPNNESDDPIWEDSLPFPGQPNESYTVELSTNSTELDVTCSELVKLFQEDNTEDKMFDFQLTCPSQVLTKQPSQDTKGVFQLKPSGSPNIFSSEPYQLSAGKLFSPDLNELCDLNQFGINNTKVVIDSQNEWQRQTNEAGHFFVNKRTGKPPLLQLKHCPSSPQPRLHFVPKGLSPALNPLPQVRDLSQKGQSKLHQFILEGYKDELMVIKWQMGNMGVKEFFQKVYQDKARELQVKLPIVQLGGGYCFGAEMLKGLKLIGQVDRKFIAFMDLSRNLLVLFDQHAVHERVRLEQFLKDYKGAAHAVADVTLELSHHDLSILKKHTKYLSAMGLVVEFGDTLKVQQIPLLVWEKFNQQDMMVEVLQTLINDIVDFLKSTRGSVPNVLPKVLQYIVNLKACRGAIKFGDALLAKECEGLLKDLSKCKLPFQCAHGRPTLAPILCLDKVRPVVKMKKPNLRKLTL